MDFHDFFPYDSYRTNQKEVISEIQDGLKARKNILFIGPNGVGKTIDNLVTSLPIALKNDFKIIYLCRTHTQNARVIEELIKINEFLNKKEKIFDDNINSPISISAVSLRGRSEMCLHRTVKKIRGTPMDIMNVCADLRKNRSCKHFNKMIQFKTRMNIDLKKIAMQSTDAQFIIKFCTKEGYCPYFFTKLLLKSVRVIVANYQWIFNPFIRETFLESIGVDLEDCILIMDECHNLPDLCAEIDSEKLTQYAIRQSIKDLEYGRAKESMIKHIKKWLEIFESIQKKVKDEEIPLEPKGVLRHYLKITGLGTINNLRNFIHELVEYGTAILEEKLSSGSNAIDFIAILVRFMYKFLDILDDNRYFLVATPNKRKGEPINIEILCMDPREIASYIYNKSYSTISCSGTIHPETFSTLLGLNETGKEIFIIEIKSPFPKRNIKILITENVNTRGANRTDSMYRRICNIIAEVLFNTPANIGIFCASYVVLQGLLENGIKDIVIFAGKKFYVEDSQNNASDNAILIKEFKNDAIKEGAVLLGVAGGRNSEGEDFPGDLMNSVIIVGFPFHRPTPRVEAKIQYYNKIFNRKGRLFAYTIPAVQRSNQAAGRPIRKLDDKGVVILLDDRFKNYLNLMVPWIQENVEKAPDKPNFIAEQLSNFFKKNTNQ